MPSSELNGLRFRRQYVISRADFECPFVHDRIEINGGYTLYAHRELVVTDRRESGAGLVLLGDMFDCDDPKKGNREILAELAALDFESLLERTARYSGRFVLLFLRGGATRIIHDATATRKAYYCRTDGSVWIASQPFLLAKILGLKTTADPARQAFYESAACQRMANSNVGDTTRFDEVRQLMPNHYYDFEAGAPIRYWPNRRIDFLPVAVVAEECSRMIRGFVAGIANRYRVMLPVTAGKDSRMLLAATRGFTDKVYCYINRNRGLKDTDNEIAIPRRLLSKIHVDYHVIDPYLPVDDSFKKVYFENNEFASSSLLPHIYNYYKNFGDRVNLPGNIASAAFEIFYTSKDMEVSAANFARTYGLGDFSHAVRCYEEWLSGCLEPCARNNVRVSNLFYWEERLANWGTQTQLEKDIAQEEFNPFNSRRLIEMFFSVEARYIEPPRFVLQRRIIRNLWPELLEVPINPGFRNAMRGIAMRLGVYVPLARIRRRMAELRA